MKGFILETSKTTIRFDYYTDDAPVTCAAFHALLPFTKIFYHAKSSGNEIWIDNVPPLDIIQENASVFTAPGEVVFGPLHPKRAKTSNCMGIYYGEGKGLDACNIFAKVAEEDADKLVALGNDTWKNGSCEITFTDSPKK